MQDPMACGEKVGYAFKVKKEPAKIGPESEIKGVYIRWLVSGKDGAPTYALRLFEAEPGSFIPGHRHPWEHEIYVIDGSMKLCIEGECYNMSKDYYAYIPPNTFHEYHIGEQGVKFLCIIPLKPSVSEDWKPECK